LEELSRLAARCEEVYGPARDIEWAFAEGQLYLLQCRAVTTRGGGREADAAAARSLPAAPAEALQRVPLFAELNKREGEQIARLFKERRFAAGDTVVKEGSGGAAFFLIDSGEATVSVGGKPRRTLTAGDYFGEIALIDEGPRSATITAASDLVCYGLTLWEFRPLVQENGAIGWKLMQTLAKELRAAEQALAGLRSSSPEARGSAG
jgi:hypothetical protein